MLGVCLGHQAICHAFGANVVRAARIMHGKTSRIKNDGATLFKGMPDPFEAGRYHSLIVEKESLPECLTITAETEEGEIMGVRHRDYPVEGIQFHPESILTPMGKRIIRNFLEMINSATKAQSHKDHLSMETTEKALRPPELSAGAKQWAAAFVLMKTGSTPGPTLRPTSKN